MMPVFIYALNDPITGQTRYVGKTINLQTRLQEHIEDSKKGKNHRCNWIRSLTKKGLKPIFEVLAQVPFSEWPQWEVDYVAAFRSLGFTLVNGTDGGENPPSWAGKKHSSESRAKMSAWQKGKSISAAHRAAIGAANKGKKHAPETCAKMSATRTGKSLSAAHCAAMKGKKRSPETCAKISSAKKGKPHSAAHCAAISSAQKGKKRGPYQKKGAQTL